MDGKATIAQIQKFIREIFKHRGIDITDVIIFGSHEAQKKKSDSDIDVIIVSNHFENRDLFERIALSDGLHKKLVQRFRKPFDLMYYSNEEWSNGDSLIIKMDKRHIYASRT
jgi:predicted nucleotidyltransferase